MMAHSRNGSTKNIIKVWCCCRLELGTLRQETVELAHAALLFGLVQLLQLQLKFIRTARNPQRSFLQQQAYFSHNDKYTVKIPSQVLVTGLLHFRWQVVLTPGFLCPAALPVFDKLALLTSERWMSHGHKELSPAQKTHCYQAGVAPVPSSFASVR